MKSLHIHKRATTIVSVTESGVKCEVKTHQTLAAREFMADYKKQSRRKRKDR